MKSLLLETIITDNKRQFYTKQHIATETWTTGFFSRFFCGRFEKENKETLKQLRKINANYQIFVIKDVKSLFLLFQPKNDKKIIQSNNNHPMFSSIIAWSLNDNWKRTFSNSGILSAAIDPL